MWVIGAVCIVLALPLLLGYFLGSRKNSMWRNLAILMIAVGIVLIVLGVV